MTAEERMRERLLTRRNEAADRVRHLSKYPKLGAMAVAQEDLQICNLAIRALQLEGEQGDPAKDQRGAAAICPNGLLPDGPECPRCGGERGPSGVDGGSWVHCPPATHHHSRTEQFEWVEIGFNARLDAEPAPAREPSAVEEVIQELREQYFCGTLVQRVERVIRQQQEELDRLRADAENFHTAYRMKCDEETKAQAVEIDRLRAENAKVTTARDDFRRQLGAERGHGQRMQAIVDEVRAENAALRERLQGGVVVPRESGSLELGDSPHLLAFMVELHSHLPEGKRPYGWADFSDEQRTRIKRAYDAMLAAAKEEGK